MMHIARSLPPQVTRDALKFFDAEILKLFMKTLGIEDEASSKNRALRTITGLPIASGGFGITALAPIADICYLCGLLNISEASVRGGRSKLQVDRAKLSSVYTTVTRKLGAVPDQFPKPAEVEELGADAFLGTKRKIRLSMFQHRLSHVHHDRILQDWIRGEKRNSRAEAQWFKAMTGKLNSAWMRVFSLPDETARHAARYRLRLPPDLDPDFKVNKKCLCGKTWDELQFKDLESPSSSKMAWKRLSLWHHLDCRNNADWITRHSRSLDEISLSLRTALIEPIREPQLESGVPNGLRGDISLKLGLKPHNIMDLSIVNPLSVSRNIPRHSTAINHLDYAEKAKRKKYRSIFQNNRDKTFTPFIISVSGAYGQSVVEWLTRVGQFIDSTRSWITSSEWKQRLVRNLAKVIHEENWLMLLKGFRRVSTQRLNNTKARVDALRV